MFKNMLLAVDGSEHALRAAKVAGEMARCLGADLRIVAAFEPVPGYLGEPNFQKSVASRMEQVETILAKALEVVGNIPGECKTEILEGPPAEAILRVAETRHNDLIIMGARGMGGLRALLLGSQSQKVVNEASCPVLLVR